MITTSSRNRPGRKPVHGHSSIDRSKTCSPTYSSWKSMNGRCKNKNDPSYNRYGGRGISVCDRWNNFENFIEDMGERPPGTSIDRVDNSKGYYKENCRWATKSEQQRNKRNSLILTVGFRSASITTWCKELGVPFYVVKNRVHRGWSHEKALFTPIREWRRKNPL